MKVTIRFFAAVAAFSLVLLAQSSSDKQFRANIPKTWDEAAIATLEVPLAHRAASPRFPSADYYYGIPAKPIYRSYPVYALGREPEGYLQQLQTLEPEVLWDDAGRAPALQTAADWIKAGETVFDASVIFGSPEILQNAAWYEKTRMPIAKDGTLPFFRYVIRKRGAVELGEQGCFYCHTRVMPDGSIVKGAQGNLPLTSHLAFRLRERAVNGSAGERRTRQSGNYLSWAVPWLDDDPGERFLRMSIEEVAAAHEAIPAGVSARHRATLFSPVQIPDLIGVRDRRYLDHTGLQVQRSIGDLMRYAAMNRGQLAGGDRLANHNGFIPGGSLPDPATLARYSDAQLYALAQFLYSLQPPPNPNAMNSTAARGRRIFDREGCAGCHTPPLYTNNKLTLAEGFYPPDDVLKKYDIMPVSVGTDPNLAMKTRRGTGLYKVPSLRGVWYRGMFSHDGSCATLEDWFDSRRLKDDYVPTGFIGYGLKTRAVKGHAFGLNLASADKTALIAFLKTL